MGITNQSILDTAAAMFHAKAEDVLSKRPPGPWQLFANVQSTSSITNTINVLESSMVPRKWIGEKEYTDFYASSLSCTVESYEASFKIRRLNLTSDNLGMIGRGIDALLSDGGQLYDKVLHDVLVSNPTGYDGVALFSTSHPRGPSGGNQSNITTTALSFANHKAIMTAGASLRTSRSEPMGIGYTHLVVGPKNEFLAREICQANTRLQLATAAGALDPAASGVAAASIPNVYAGSLTVVVDPRLVGDYDDYCYYIDASKSSKLIEAFELRAPMAVTATEWTSSARMSHDEYLMSVEFDLGACAGAWQVGHAIIL